MSKSDHQGSALPRLIKLTLTFTNLGNKIQIRDENSNEHWLVSAAYAYALLFSSFKDEQGTEPLIDIDPSQLLAETWKKITFEGAFPKRQILCQQHRLKYFLSRNESLRDRVSIIDGDFYFYICDERFAEQWCADAFAELAGNNWDQDIRRNVMAQCAADNVVRLKFDRNSW